jgi:hypothetical protein
MIPVIVFAYNRPDLLLRLLDCLRADAVPMLWAFSDGPRSSVDVPLVGKVRSILRSVDWCSINLVERPVNIGLGESIKDGVTKALSHFESILVFEDDLIFVPGTYRFLSAALNRYRDDANGRTSVF